MEIQQNIRSWRKRNKKTTLSEETLQCCGGKQSEYMNINLPPQIYIHKELIHMMKFIVYVVRDHFNQPGSPLSVSLGRSGVFLSLTLFVLVIGLIDRFLLDPCVRSIFPEGHSLSCGNLNRLSEMDRSGRP